MSRRFRVSRRTRRLLSVVTAVVTASALAGGCTAGGAEITAAGGTGPLSGVLRTALPGDMGTYDPDNGFEVAGLGAIKAVYEGLVDYEPGTTEIVPKLAESFTVSPDGLVYTFTLRTGVTFHDGSPMTSASVKASFDRRADPQFILSYFLANVAETSTPDPQTFIITLSAPQGSFLDNLASAWGPKIVGPDALEAHAGEDRSGSWLSENADGTGPFRLTSFNRGSRYTLERFDDYWGEPASFETVQIGIVPDIAQQVLQLRNGELDVVLHGYPYAQLTDLPDGLTASSYNDLGLELAFVNTSNNLTTLERRRRLMAAINPQGWVEEIFGTYARPALSLFPRAMLEPGVPYEWPDAEDAPAVDMPEIEIVYAAEEALVQQRVADTLIAKLREAGIKATARSIPGAQISSFPKDPAGSPDILLAQNNPDSAHPESQTSLFYGTGAPLNVFAVSNPAADEAFAAAGAEPDKTRRDALYAEAGRLSFQDGLFLPLADLEDVIVHRAGLTDLGSRPAVPWNIDFGTVRWEQ